MNDHELDLALADMGAHHASVRVPARLRQRLSQIPTTTTPERRGFFPPLTGRFQSMFSATKFLVSGVIVALFGGFLLAGILTQPSDEPLPPAAASATSSPAARTPEQSVRSALLPGVELTTNEVGPGVYRIVGDGVRDLSGRIARVTVTPEGDVWIELGEARNWSLVRLGEPGVSLRLGRQEPWGLGLTAAGSPMVSAHVTRVFDGEAWTRTELTALDECVQKAPWGSSAVGVDGSCWTVEEGRLARIDGDGTRTEFTQDELGLDPDEGVNRPAVGPDGTVWVQVATGSPPGCSKIFKGLLALDGVEWSRIPYDGDAVRVCGADVAVGPDGIVWVVRTGPDPSPILSWDGGSWTIHRYERSARARLRPILPWPNGTVWFGSEARWDGATLGDFASPIAWNEGTPLAGVSDRSAWTVVGGKLYVITPEAVAVAE